MQDLKLAIVQTALFWEDPEANRSHFFEKLSGIREAVDVAVLPEMFSTGFTMNPQPVAEPMEGPTMTWMHSQAMSMNCVVTGSIVIEEQGRYYNRLIWMPPDGHYQWYDKKHLFSYAGEDKHYTPGSSKLVVKVKGWKLMPVICYDLRFPVWSKNHYHPDQGFDYDCILVVANWPASRSHAWRILLMARAIENLSYMVGVNRIGSDERGIGYSGDSAAIDPLGENLSAMLPNADQVEVVTLSRCTLDSHRERFRVWADWDDFTLSE
jgi:omega-amidase